MLRKIQMTFKMAFKMTLWLQTEPQRREPIMQKDARAVRFCAYKPRDKRSNRVFAKEAIGRRLLGTAPRGLRNRANSRHLSCAPVRGI